MNTGEIPVDVKQAIITTNTQGQLQEPSQELPFRSLYIIFNKNTGKNISKKYPPIPRNASENEPQGSGRSCLSQLLEHHNNLLEELEKLNNVDVIYLDFAKAFDKVDHGILLNSKKSELMVKSVCGYTIFYQTDNNVLPSMEHQVQLKFEVAYPKDQC